MTAFFCGKRRRTGVPKEREDDLALLAALLGASVDLGDEEETAFRSMRDFLEGADRYALSENQRAWATRRAVDLGLSWGDPAKRNAGIPRGAPVETPAVLRVLPLKPPGRRS